MFHMRESAFLFGRIKSHLTSSRDHLMWLLNEHIASCRPLYQIFEANRLLFCRHTMAPLNGLWFAGLACIVLWVVATPLSLALASIYRRMTCVKGMRHTNSHQYVEHLLVHLIKGLTFICRISHVSYLISQNTFA